MIKYFSKPQSDSSGADGDRGGRGRPGPRPRVDTVRNAAPSTGRGQRAGIDSGSCDRRIFFHLAADFIAPVQCTRPVVRHVYDLQVLICSVKALLPLHSTVVRTSQSRGRTGGDAALAVHACDLYNKWASTCILGVSRDSLQYPNQAVGIVALSRDSGESCNSVNKEVVLASKPARNLRLGNPLRMGTRYSVDLRVDTFTLPVSE